MDLGRLFRSSGGRIRILDSEIRIINSRLTSNRFTTFIVPSLLAIVSLLALANLQKDGYLDGPWLAGHKDAIDAVSTITTTILAFCAALVAYLRFFRGRLMAARADVAPRVVVIKGPGDLYLHAVIVEVTNVGTVSLLEPQISVRARARTGDEDADASVVRVSESRNSFPPNMRKGISVIDSGEKAVFFFEHLFAKDVWAVTYEVLFESISLGAWRAGMTVANQESGN